MTMSLSATTGAITQTIAPIVEIVKVMKMVKVVHVYQLFSKIANYEEDMNYVKFDG